MGRLLGIDYGTKRVGVAISSPEQTLAVPLTILETVSALERLAEIIREEAPIEKLIIGLPTELSGDPGKLDQQVRAFAQAITDDTNIPVVFVDERMTSKEAKKSLRDSHAQDDAVAAMLLLQSYLDQHNLK